MAYLIAVNIPTVSRCFVWLHYTNPPVSISSKMIRPVPAKSASTEARYINRFARAISSGSTGVPPKLSALITKKLDIITIGIGASPECDAQVLVWQDMLGISDFKPKFAKHFAEVGETMREAFRAYDGEVKSGVFPASEHTFVKSDCTEEFLASLDAEY